MRENARGALVGFRVGAALGFVCATVGGCGDDGPYSHLARRAEEVRELAFLQDVPYRTLTPEQFRDEVSQEIDEETEAELREFADTYGRLGFFDVNLDLRPILTQSRINATAAFYSTDDARITFVGDPEDGTVVHEYVHALQDQHHDLDQYDAGATSSDSFLARRAVVEGDAVLAESRFLIEEQPGGRLDLIDYRAYFTGWSEISERYLAESEYPLIFNAYPSFVYTYGLFFSAANLFGVSPRDRLPPPPPHDWTRQDELFTSRVPATTAEILGQNDAVLTVGISGVPGALAGDLERIGSDTLGTWYTHLLFRRVADGPLLTQDWDGDQVLFARHIATGAVGVLWASVWNDELAATQAETWLHALHDSAGEPLVIERRGLSVVLARNFPAEVVRVLVDAAFAGSSEPLLGSRPPLHVRVGMEQHPAPRPR